MARPSLVFIGEGNILLSSLQQASTFALEIKGVFSNTAQVQAWCRDTGIAVFTRSANIEKALHGAGFDYLLSINNPRIIPDSELRLAGKLNINYHDSLLPAYAGVNASSWAILHGETTHGVSLHVMEAGIDTGHVLESEVVPVLLTDSALALNLRCLHAFRVAFTRLLTTVASSAPFVFRAQDPGKRSYFGLFACPPNMGVLNFHDDIRKVHDLARALEYGHHENSLGSPKVLTSSGRYLLVKNADVTLMTPPAQDTAPGTIVDIVDDTLIVKTATDLILLSVAELDGSPLSAENLLSYAVTAGRVLQSPRCPPTDLITSVRKKEAFWRRTMQKYDPTLFLRQKINLGAYIMAESETKNVKELSLQYLPHCASEDSEKTDVFLLSTFIYFMARMCCTEQVHVGIVADKTAIPEEYKDLYSDVCPCVFHIDQSLTATVAFDQYIGTVKKLKSSHTFLKDMIYRYPELQERRREIRHNLVIATPKELQQDQDIKQRLLRDCNMLMTLTKSEITIFYTDKPNCNVQDIFDTLHHYGAYVKSVCTLTPLQPLQHVQLLSAEEMATLYPLTTTEENGFAAQGSDLYRLFDEQCHRSPNATAIRSTSLSLTYSQMKDAVISIASMLGQYLGGEKKCVSLHLPNSLSYVISLMACCKVSCPFVPLPVDLPTDRVLFSLLDARVTMMITTEAAFNNDKLQALSRQPALLHKAPDETLVLLQIDSIETQSNGVCDTSSSGNPAEFSSDNLQTLARKEAELLDDCCYVMYTSGSTGRPKGVQVRMPGVVNLAAAQIAALELSPDDVTAQFASIGFDASISEIVTALLSGGTLAVLYERERLGKEFVHAMALMGVTVITLPPSVLNIYSPSQFPSLRKVVTAGEPCTSLTAFKWTPDAGHASVCFFNAYGPTEATVCGTMYKFRREDYSERTVQDLAIGNSIQGVVVYILDDHFRPVPADVLGEIYMGGAGVSGGYIGHALNKNASNFIPNPLLKHTLVDKYSLKKSQSLYSNGVNTSTNSRNHVNCVVLQDGLNNKEKTLLKEVGFSNIMNLVGNNGFVNQNNDVVNMSRRGKRIVTTLYKTGDLAFQDKHGRLTFVGRLDDQVKIRGQRVDLSEIEQVIMQQPTVEMAVVVKHGCLQCQEPSIVAFVAPTVICMSELKENLSRTLPKYMIPNYICKLQATDFPVSINGKINRKALETDERVHVQELCLDSGHLNEDQLTIAKLWCQVLGLDEARANSMHRLSSFVELGGNSLHLVILQRLVEDAFHVSLSFIDVGAADTIQNFADMLKRKKDIVKHDSDAKAHDKASSLREVILNDSVLNLHEFLPSANEDDLSKNLNMDRRPPSLFGGNEDAKRIMISGVTGFLGAFLLAEVLEKTAWQVICMVREKNETRGMDRVVANLNHYGLWRQSFSPRLFVVLSDVSEPNLGISPDTYHYLCVHVDIVFINAATMNFNYGYDDHRQANVLGTKEFIRFAALEKKKFMFFTSSLSVLLFPCQLNANTDHMIGNTDNINGNTDNIEGRDSDQRDYHPVLKECDCIADPLLVEGGYGQSKWASERLVLQALNHLPGGAVFRPARISGHSVSGIGPKNDLFGSLLNGIYSLGSYPDLNFPFDLTPVDFCARAMVEITIKVIESTGCLWSPSSISSKGHDVKDKASPSERHSTEPAEKDRLSMPPVFHLFNKNTVPFHELFGPSISAVSVDEWRVKLRTADPSCPLVPFTPFFLSPFWDRARHWPVFDTTNTDSLVSQDTLQLLRPSKELLAIYKNYFNLHF